MQPAPLLLDDRAGEYVELANLGPTPVALADLRLLLPNGTAAPLLRPARPWVAAGEVALCTPLGQFAAIQVPGMRLPDRAGRLELLWRGSAIDVAQWLRARPGPKVPVGVSLERRDGEGDGARLTSWRQSRVPLRGLERGSPGQWRPDILRRPDVPHRPDIPNSKEAHDPHACGTQKREPGPRPGPVGRWGGT
ncbi:MAG: hypothetical protein EXR79_04165 [Myxococcales bacterium]|nr:hypothetical protein [Myxococcales bacterium]